MYSFVDTDWNYVLLESKKLKALDFLILVVMKIENKEISKCKYRYYVFWYKKHETDAVGVYSQ